MDWRIYYETNIGKMDGTDTLELTECTIQIWNCQKMKNRTTENTVERETPFSKNTGKHIIPRYYSMECG